MPVANIVMLVAGLALTAWTTYQHLGRSPGARDWSRAGPRTLTEKTTLVVHPLMAVICVLGGIANDTIDPSGAGAVLWGVVAACLLVLGTFILLPVPVPDVAKPRWYREYWAARTTRD
jgi:hypothetical protein